MLFGLYAVNKLFYFQLNVAYPHLDWIWHVGQAINVLLSATAPIAVLLVLGFRRRWLFAVAALSLAGVVLRRRHAAHCLLVSLARVSNYAIPFLRYNQGFGFGVLMLYLLVSSIILLARESKRRAQAELRNSRLQLELLKSKIQPHFVLNSLTSAIEWIETNPKEGAQAPAGDLRPEPSADFGIWRLRLRGLRHGRAHGRAESPTRDPRPARAGRRGRLSFNDIR